MRLHISMVSGKRLRPDIEYSLEVDSAAFQDIYGLVSKPVKQGFKVNSLDTYGTLLITVYLILSGLPAITKIGLGNFLFGTEWSSTASDPKYGILPFILTSVYGTCGAILLGVPVGFLTAVFLSKMAPKKLRSVMESAVSLLAGIPSVVYGLVGMLVLVPGIRKLFHVLVITDHRYRSCIRCAGRCIDLGCRSVQRYFCRR